VHRLFRILLKALTVLSLLLFVATVALWVRSYPYEDRLSYGRSSGGVRSVSSYEGSLYFSTSSLRMSDATCWRWMSRRAAHGSVIPGVKMVPGYATSGFYERKRDGNLSLQMPTGPCVRRRRGLRSR
jgi:hypothetical protein